MDINKTTVEELKAKIQSLEDENAYLRHLTLEMETDGIQLNGMLYQLMLDSFPFAAWMKDTTGRFISVNKLFELKNGKSNSEIISLTDYDFSPPELAKEYVDEDALVIKNKKEIFVIREFVENGKVEYYESYKSPVLSNNGSVIATFGFSKNITEQHLSEIKIKQSEEKLRSLTEKLPIGIYRTNFDGEFLHVNKAFAHILGYNRVDDLIKRNAFDFYSKKSERKQSIEILKDVKINSEINQIVRKDGKSVWIKDTAKLNKDSQNNQYFIDGFIELVNDPNDSNFKQFIENANYGICVFNEAQIEYANPLFCKLMNFSLSEIAEADLSIFRIVDENSFQKLNKTFEDLKKGLLPKELFHINLLNNKSEIIALEVVSYDNCFPESFKLLGLIRDINIDNK
jgi:PAS domain S-box-containing protein